MCGGRVSSQAAARDKLIRLPHIVLVAVGKIIAGDRRIAGETEEISDEALLRAVPDIDRSRAEPVFMLRYDRQRLVGRAIVGNEQPPVGETLMGKRRKLSGKEPCTVERTQQYGNTGHLGARDLLISCECRQP